MVRAILAIEAGCQHSPTLQHCWCLMGRYSSTELKKFRDTSRCSACVHYSGCQLWLALLLMSDELDHPGLDIIVPDINKACPMFFPWTTDSARRAIL